MVFNEKPGICKKCGHKLIACKNLCKKCYMKERNGRKDIKDGKKEWEKNNKWKRKLRQAQRCIKTRTNEFISTNILKEIFERDNYTCQYCGSKRNLSIDHKIPISKGGKNTKKNLMIACFTCNALKSDMSVKKFKNKYIKNKK